MDSIYVRPHGPQRYCICKVGMQIELFEAQPKGSSIPAEDTYDTALAYVAEGYRCRKPQHVQTAHRLLTQVAQQPQANSDLGVHL